MRFSSSFIDKVRDANSLVDFFSEFTQIKRGGGRVITLCPFPNHKEKTPSFSISDEKQVYHCFGCKKSGNLFTAVQELKGLSFPETIEYLANKAGIPIPKEYEQAGPQKELKSRREKLIKINTYATQFFFKQLQSQIAASGRDGLGWAYCKSRRLSQDLIKTFQIGYTNSNWNDLEAFFNRTNTPLKEAQSLGLIRTKKEGSGYYDQFRERLMFPIFSHKGECVGFGGRALTEKQTPKYLNSPESELFQKGQTFYGLNETAKYIRMEDSAIVVEGYMDLLALYGAGIKNVVATLGTALTEQHAKLIKRYTPNVIVLFDGDSAGQNAAERSLPILLAEGLMPKAITLPGQLDPDEYIQENGAAALTNLLKKAPDLFSVILDGHMKNYRGNPAEKVAIVANSSFALNQMLDANLKDLYVVEIAQRLGVDKSWVLKSLASEKSSTKNRYPIAASEPKDGALIKTDANNVAITQPELEYVKDMGPMVILKGAPKAELELLNLLLASEEWFNLIWDSEVVAELTHPGVQEMIMKAERHYRQMPNEFAKLTAFLMNLTKNPEHLALHLGEPFSSMGHEETKKYIADCIKWVKERLLKSQSKALAASLRTSPDNQQEKLEQIMNIHKNKITLRKDRES